jgi:anti-anti-sigma factor
MNSAETTLPRLLRLEGEMTIYRAAELRATLSNAMSGVDQCTVDLAAVTEIDSAGVQLLIAATRTARERHCELSFIGHSAPVLEALNVFGLGAQPGDASVTIDPFAHGATPHAEQAYGL